MEELEIRQYWKIILETMPAGLMVVNPEGEIVMVNSALSSLMGYAAEELVGQTCLVLGCNICCKAREKGMGSYCALFNKSEIRKQRCTVIGKDGKEIPVLKNASVLKDSDGNVIGGVETLTDLSDMVTKERLITDLRKALEKPYGFMGFVGNSPEMIRIYDLIKSAAASDAPVMITGDSGTGKELAAQAVHQLSGRQKGPFIRVNCAALNESLLESELFGHVKGAFTGADKTRIGRFEAAHGGSIFLDEIGDMPLSVQVKLLRVLQEKEVEKVGDHKPVKVDVRIITATNRDLHKRMQSGEFREDLYYRIGVIPVEIPALRDRRDDIPLLIRAFMEKTRLKTGKNISGISNDAMDVLLAHNWPGNVRELLNAVEHAFVLCPAPGVTDSEKDGGSVILPAHLPRIITGVNKDAMVCLPESKKITDKKTLRDDDERSALMKALIGAEGNKALAARNLGVSRVTLYSKIKKYGIALEKRIRE